MRPTALSRPEAAAALVAFSPSGGDALALAAADGRIKVFDTASGKLKLNIVPSAAVSINGDVATTSTNGHLSEQYTCLTWGSCSAKESGKGKKKSAMETKLVLVGTATGDVLAYDVSQGKLKWRTRECNEGGVLGLAFGRSAGGMVLSTGQDGQICLLEASTGAVKTKFQAGKAALHAIDVTPDHEHALVGSSALSMWTLKTNKCVCKFTGHPTHLQSLSISPDGSFAISCAKGERNAVVWWLQGPYKKKEAIAAGLLNTEDSVVSVGAYAGPEGTLFAAVAVTSTGEAYVWDCPAGSKARTVEASLVARVQIEGTKSATIPGLDCIHAARMEGSSSGRSLLVARGSLVKPVFERLDLSEAADQPGHALTLSPIVEGLLLPPASQKSKSQQSSAGPARVVGPGGLLLDEAGEAEMLLKPSMADSAAAKRKRQASEVPSSVQAMELDSPEAEAGALTLGERVAALEIGAGKPAGAEDEEEEQGVTSTSGAIKADSLGVLLLQALRSEDSALLERCLNVSNDKVIKNTIRRLPASASVQFLKALVARLQSRPARAEQLGQWARALLAHHAAYLTGAPGASGALVALYQTLDARLAHFKPLLSLAGRLDLVMSQVSQQEDTSAEGGDGEGLLSQGPLTTFELSDGEDDGAVAVEDPFLASTRDDSDEEDSDDDSDDDLEEEDEEEEVDEDDDDVMDDDED